MHALLAPLLEDFHPTFHFIHGSSNILADALSRLPLVKVEVPLVEKSLATTSTLSLATTNASASAFNDLADDVSSFAVLQWINKSCLTAAYIYLSPIQRSFLWTTGLSKLTNKPTKNFYNDDKLI